MLLQCRKQATDLPQATQMSQAATERPRCLAPAAEVCGREGEVSGYFGSIVSPLWLRSSPASPKTWCWFSFTESPIACVCATIRTCSIMPQLRPGTRASKAFRQGPFRWCSSCHSLSCKQVPWLRYQTAIRCKKSRCFLAKCKHCENNSFWRATFVLNPT